MKERDLKIVEMYNDGYNPNEIAKIFVCSVGTVYNALKREKQCTRNGYHGIKKDLVNDVIKLYKNNESVFSICNKLGLYQDKVKRILHENNIKTISSAKRNNPNFNEDYFENIDSEDKAYWLGWLITDGCINDTSISITLKECDTYILEQFQSDLGLMNKIKQFNKKYSRLMFWSKKMIEDLAKYGIVPNKTFTIDLPKIREDLIPSLLRGCVDGDGSITYLTYSNRLTTELMFCGNRTSVESFNKLACQLIGIEEKNIVPNNSIFRVRWSSRKEIVDICNKLYENSEKHKLIRKYEKYIKIKKLIE